MNSRADGSFRYDGPWRKVRLAVLERDGWKCRIGGPGCRVRASEVNHVVAVSLGGGVYDPENLRAACSVCNAARGGRLGAFQSARFSKRIRRGNGDRSNGTGDTRTGITRSSSMRRADDVVASDRVVGHFLQSDL